jgi:FKBP-type peptidyl-prolyl cis-trans isomerase
MHLFGTYGGVMRYLKGGILPALAVSCATVLACRPAGYQAPPKDPNEPSRTIPEPPSAGISGDELTHVALFGGDTAPPSVMTPPDNALISPSGLTSSVLTAGTGSRTPQPGDIVVLHFVGWDNKGERFDSSIARGKPDRMRIDTLAPGWREGVEQMVVGEKRRLWIPERLGFGPVPSPGRPIGDLVMDVELLEIIRAEPAPNTPSDLAAPAKDTTKTASGLQYKVIQPGTGSQHPTPQDQVLVHYSGWTTDGTLFDSSITRGTPLTIGVSDVIPGWTEILQRMVPGEKLRVWIPARLAYGEHPAQGQPAGDLVFDIELLEIR